MTFAGFYKLPMKKLDDIALCKTLKYLHAHHQNDPDEFSSKNIQINTLYYERLSEVCAILERFDSF